jgi:2-hydroxy-4-carboxymuconate semialdehyde hemiacetal dehydrogenase
VGTGSIATQHMKAFVEAGGVHPRWAVSRREPKAREFGEHWGFDQFGTDWEAPLSDPKVDLLVITSPSAQHAEQAIRALEAGKDVIVEIPVALNLADAERVADRSATTKRRALVCHTMRSFPAIREVRRRVQTGELSLTQIAGYFAIPRRRNQGMGGRERNWVDNLLWHHGCHMVDVAMWVLGVDTVEHVSAMLGKSHTQFGMAMDASVHFQTTKQQLVTHALTYNAEQICWEVRFMGDQDTLTYRNGRLLNEDNEQVVPESYWADLVQQNKAMLASIQAGAPSDFDVAAVLPAMKVLQEAQSSAVEHR